jgi:hypothetical protein
MSKPGLCFAIAAAAVGILPRRYRRRLQRQAVGRAMVAACRVVTVNQQQANADAPRFEEIARGSRRAFV